VSSKKIRLGQNVTFNWSIPGATKCFLYGPTSTSTNAPDEFDAHGSVTVTPTKAKSDGQAGRLATYTLACQDTGRLNEAGNYPTVFTKRVVITLDRAKTARPSCTVTASGPFGTVLAHTGATKRVSIKDGESVLLSWVTKKADYVAGPFGDRMETSGEGSVGPSVSDTYRFNAVNGGKEKACTIEVHVS
jgi:hypothetical protein